MTSKNIFYQCIGITYLLAYLSLYIQYHGLVGTNGILPAELYIERIRNFYIERGIQDDISIFKQTGNLAVLANSFGFTVDCLCEILLWVGMISSSILASGFIHMFFFLISWLSYLTLIHTGQTFLSFQWDILLCECGFLCILSTLFFQTKSSSIPMWSFRFLAWKLMFSSGLVKLQSRCPTWESLTALEYHFASQCIPTPLAWVAYQLPSIILRFGVGLTFIIEIPFTLMLVAPFQYVRQIGVIFQVFLQVIIFLTGNYTFFNILTIFLMISSWLDDYNENDYMIGENNKYSKSQPVMIYRTTYRKITSFISLHMEDGPLVLIAQTLRVFDQSILGKMIQIFSCLIFIITCFLWMLHYEYNDSMPWWFGDSLTVKLKWNELKDLVIPTSFWVIFCCIFMSIVSYSFEISKLMSSSRSKGYIRGMIDINIYRPISILWSSIGLCILIGWILLSASNLENLGKISPYIPSSILLLRNQTLPFHITSSYGLFRRITGVGENIYHSDYPNISISKVSRPEIVIEGNDGESWKTIIFLYKPTSLYQPPSFVAPHQPRLDWQMWFAALGDYGHNPWLISFIYKLLHPSKPIKDKITQQSSFVVPPEISSLIHWKRYPFQSKSPLAIRALLYDYDFTKANISDVLDNDDIANISIKIYHSLNNFYHQNDSSPWWTRSNPREYLPVLEYNNPSIVEFLKGHGIPPQKYKSLSKMYRECKSQYSVFQSYFITNLISIDSQYYEMIHERLCSIILIPRDYEDCWNSWYYKISFSIITSILFTKYLLQQGTKKGREL